MASHSNILALEVPWTEEPDGLQSTGWQSQTGFTNLCYFLLHSKVNQLFVYKSLLFFWTSFTFMSPQSTEQSFLFYTVGSHYLSVLYIASIVCVCVCVYIYIYMYVSVPNSQFLPSLFPPQYPYICSLCLCLYFCFANKIIYTVFLDSTYLR